MAPFPLCLCGQEVQGHALGLGLGFVAGKWEFFTRVGFQVKEEVAKGQQ